MMPPALLPVSFRAFARVLSELAHMLSQSKWLHGTECSLRRGTSIGTIVRKATWTRKPFHMTLPASVLRLRMMALQAAPHAYRHDASPMLLLSACPAERTGTSWCGQVRKARRQQNLLRFCTAAARNDQQGSAFIGFSTGLLGAIFRSKVCKRKTVARGSVGASQELDASAALDALHPVLATSVKESLAKIPDPDVLFIGPKEEIGGWAY